MDIGIKELAQMDERRQIETIINMQEQEKLKKDMIAQIEY